MSPARKDETQPEAAGTASEAAAADAADAGTKAADAATKAAEAAADAADAAEAAAQAASEATEAAETERAAPDDEAKPEPDEEAKAARRRLAADDEAKPAARSTSRSRTPAKARAKKAKSAAASTEVKVELPAEIFDAKVNVPLIHQVVVAQQAAARQGTHATKTRGDVRGGGRKPYRQKGTGRARQGSVRAPQFAGGGTVHGPVPRSYVQKTPKKMKAAALRGALSDRARHGLVQVVSGFVDGDTPKTADALAVLAVVTGAPSARVLVVADSADQVTRKSLRNATGVHLIAPGQLNTYDVLTSDRVVFTSAAYESFVARAGAQEER
jgi:large subunit ribosomal protein L4